MATQNGTAGFHAGANRPPAPPRMIVLGFYDGPTAGLIQFGDRGPVFRFTMPDEDGQLAAGEDAREYLFQPLPPDALDLMAAAISPHLLPEWPVWFPVWRFPSPGIERTVNSAVDAIEAEAGPPVWRVRTRSYYTLAEFDAEPVTTGQPA